MQQLKHDNIVELIDFYEDETHLSIVLEFMHCSLQQLLKVRGGTLEEQEAAKVIKMVASGVSHMHKHGFVHFDLKPANILLNLNEDGQIVDIKIADFGLSREKRSDFKAGKDSIGTIAFMAPQMLELDQVFDERIDAWSLGIMLC